MTATIVLGSNCGDRETNILRALGRVKECVEILRSSPVYESRDYLGSGKRYLNLVAEIEGRISEKELNRYFKQIETELGRTEVTRLCGDVPVDIDIVVWEGSVVRPEDYATSYFREGMALLEESVEVNFIR